MEKQRLALVIILGHKRQWVYREESNQEVIISLKITSTLPITVTGLIHIFLPIKNQSIKVLNLMYSINDPSTKALSVGDPPNLQCIDPRPPFTHPRQPTFSNQSPKTPNPSTINVQEPSSVNPNTISTIISRVFVKNSIMSASFGPSTDSNMEKSVIIIANLYHLIITIMWNWTHRD